MRTIEDQGEASADERGDLRWRRISEEEQLLAILDAPRLEGEPFDVAFRRKEHELGEVIAGLSALDSLELQRRLRMRLPDDGLAARFGRLTAVRQARLLAFLMSSRRRFAVAQRGSGDE